MDAMDTVKDSGDDVSESMHNLLSHLDVLDDAMDDWDENPAEEQGEEYDDLMYEESEGSYGSPGRHGLPLHHSTSSHGRGNSRRGDR